MSTPKQREDFGLPSYKTGQYDRLNKAYTYSCPHMNNVYKDFNNGVNCLCASNQDRTVMDKVLKSNNQINAFHASTNTLGWKLL
jgi:hypothetical protein